MPTDCINFGFYFNQLSPQCNPENLKVIKQRCKEFLVKLAEELQLRIPDNVRVLEKMCVFAPDVASSQNKEDITEIAVFFQAICSDVDETVKEWNLLHRLEIEKCSSNEYWTKVSEDKNAGGMCRFKHISALARALLSLPFSNASVERAFSIVNIIKNKLRNKMSIKTADAIMRVRVLLPNTCANFEPTARMLIKFTSEQLYQSEFEGEILNAFPEI